MEYRGYSIDHERNGSYLVTGPEGQWSADTVEEAKRDIDAMEEKS